MQGNMKVCEISLGWLQYSVLPFKKQEGERLRFFKETGFAKELSVFQDRKLAILGTVRRRNSTTDEKEGM
jgi:hypothetical protein